MGAIDPRKGDNMDNAVQTLKETARLRKTRAKISSGAGVIILLLIVYLAVDMVSFIKTYNASKVVQDLSKEIPKMMSSDPMQKLLNDVREKMLPKYVKEISEKMTAAEPKFQAECYAVLDNLANEIGPAVQERVAAELARILQETETKVRVRHPDLKQEDIAQILTTLQKEIERQYTDRLAEQLTYLFGDINKSLESIRADAGYKTMVRAETQKLEKMLLTTALELTSYEIDPELGATR